IRLITAGYHVSLGKDKGLDAFNQFITGLDEQFGVTKEDLRKRYDPDDADINALTLQDKIRLITAGYHVSLGKDKGLNSFNQITQSIIDSGYTFSEIPNIKQKTLAIFYIYNSLSYVLNHKMDLQTLLSITEAYQPSSSGNNHVSLKKAHYFNIQVRLEYRRIKQQTDQASGARLAQGGDSDESYPVKLTQADENGNKWIAETVKGGKMRYSISRARQGMDWGLKFQAIRLGRQLPSIADVWLLREQGKFGIMMLTASKWIQRVFDNTFGLILDVLFFTASPFWTDYTDAVTVVLTNTDTGRLTGYYVYYPKDNLSSLVIVDPLNRGTGAVDILFEDMKRRIAKNDPNFKIHAKIYRASPRVPLSKIGNFFGTIDERKKALGIRSSVTVIPYADPDLMIEPVTEPLKYSTKSLPMRYPQLYDLITEYLHGLASETPVDVLMMGAGLDERFLEEYPASPQTVEVIASLADREANLKIIDVNETVHSIIREPKYYLWYKTFEGSRKLRNEYRDSTSYEVMKQNLAGVLKDAGPDDFEWDSGATKEKVYRVDLSELQDIQIETVLSEFSAVEDYGIESQNIIISTIALAYDLMRMNMDQRNQFIAKLARALKPGGVMIVHADEFVLMHPDLSEYPFHLRNDQVIKIGFSDVQKMLKKMTGSDFQLQLYGPLVEIKKSAPVKKSSQIGARLSESNSQTESNKTQRSFQKPGFTNYFMGAIVAGTHLLLMESLVALTFDLNSIFMTVMFSALFGVNLFRTIVEILNGQKILPGRLIDYPQSMHYAISRWQNFTWPALLVFSYVGFANTDIDFITIRTDSFNSRTIGISMMTALATYYILQPLMLKMNVKNAFDPRPYWRPREANFTVRSKAVSFYNSVIKASIYEEIERYIQIYAYTSILSSYIGSSAAWGAALWLSTAHFWALHEGRKNRMHSIVGLINGVILISFQSIWLPILIHSVLNLRHVLESEKRVIQQIKKLRKKVIQNKFSKELDLKIRYDDFEEGRSKIVFQKTISGEETMRIKMLPGSVFLSP
ncbi:MAG: CPBP family intramembrane metalloprotease, partial [Candidatus Omnitrophica bacterium]|nr:CPBP family intramembrane metalloprotease [Candidatus Omnitrophota bacterium]